MPDAVIFAGANGAGKTTLARQLVPALYPASVYLNADEIQRASAEFAHPVAAGKEMLRRLAEAVDQQHSFVIETTLSSRLYAKQIAVWKTLGYRVEIHFIEVPSADFAVRRVAQRVAAGGHNIPELDIRRRYERGLRLFSDVYRKLADAWYHWHTDDEGLTITDSYDPAR